MRLPASSTLPCAAAALALLIAGCGSSSSEQTTGGGETGGGAATISKAPSGLSEQKCVDKALDPPEVVVIGTGTSCAEGRATVSAWTHKLSCSSPSGASRYACSVGKLRCLGTTTDRGTVVNCSRQGRSISFAVKPG